ncbi:MAG: alpha-amylase family glycosyl hydrolase [Bacteroidales bacterium]
MMIKKILFTIFMLVTMVAQAAVVTTDPEIVQVGSEDVTIYFYAKEGNAGLTSLYSGVYAHTGVITNKSTSDSDWKYAPDWCDNSDKYALTRVSLTDRIWSLNIGDMREYYGITDEDEVIQKLAFVFRNSTGTLEGKTEEGGDIFIVVYDDGLAVSLNSSATSSVLTSETSTVTLTATSSMESNLKIFIDDVNSAAIAEASNATTLAKEYTFPQGDYKVIAQAELDGDIVRDTISICHRSESQAVNYSGTLKQGATVNADGTVTFCLLAPNKSNVIVVGEWDDYTVKNSSVMNYQGDYFWITVSGLDLDREYGYYYLVDDVTGVADPYSELVLDPWNDKYINQTYEIYPNLKDFPTEVGNIMITVFKGNKDEYNWEVENFEKPAKENLIIYEILLREFTDEGSVDATLAKLDYLEAMGINAIELMPFNEFDGNSSWGYNPNFYMAPDKAYGTPDDYKLFIDECHKRGIAVIMDVVFNHSWGQHPWCKMYYDSTNNCPSSDSPFQNVSAPHNWSVGNDWKLESDYVKDHFKDVLKYWIDEYKIDGYRFDLSKGLGDSDSYASDYDGSNYNSSRIANLKGFYDAIKAANSDAYVIMEHFCATTEENELSNYGMMVWSNYCSAFAQAAMGYSSSSSFSGVNPVNSGRPFGGTVAYFESHDEERAAWSQNNYGESGVKGNTENSMRRLGANAAFMFLSPGAKMFWQFAEMGYDVSIDQDGYDRVDPKPTHWEYLDDEYRKGLYDSYCEIINIRTNNPDLFTSDASFTMQASTSNWDNGRFITISNSVGKELIVVYNPTFTHKTFSYTFSSSSETYYINSKSYGTTPSFSASASTISVPAHSYVVISNMDDPAGVNGVEADIAKDEIIIYPNPAENMIYINNSEVAKVDIYSLSGALVKSVIESNAIEISGLFPGTYIVKVATDSKESYTKLIKK